MINMMMMMELVNVTGQQRRLRVLDVQGAPKK